MKSYVIGAAIGYVGHDSIKKLLVGDGSSTNKGILPRDANTKELIVDSQTFVMGATAAAWYFKPMGDNHKYIVGAGLGYLAKDMALVPTVA